MSFTNLTFTVGNAVKASEGNALQQNIVHCLEHATPLLQFHSRGQRSTTLNTYDFFNDVKCFFPMDGDLLEGLGLRWEIGYYMAAGAGTCYVRLYNETDGSAVTNSEVSMAETTTASRIVLPASSASYFNLVSGEKWYRPQFKTTNSGFLFYVDFLRLMAVKV